jgi:site-specific DNA recombinase
MLQNRLYRGEIVHKNEAYPGEHMPIIDEDLWQEVQKTLAANRVDRGAGNGNPQVSLLAGLIYDAHGEPMTPSHAVKKGVRYRYYVSKSLVTGGTEAASRGQRIPAVHIEALITDRIRAWLADPVAVLNAVEYCEPDLIAQKRLLNEARRLATDWSLDAEQSRAILRAIVTRVRVHSDRIELTLDQMGAALRLNAKDQERPIHAGGDDRERYLTVVTIPARLKRRGIEMKMVVEDGSGPADVDTALERLLLRAHAIRTRLLEEPSLPLKEIAAEQRISSSYVTRLLRLAFLAPDILTAILNGRHPPQLTANRLMEDTRLPLDWIAQRRLLCS